MIKIVITNNLVNIYRSTRTIFILASHHLVSQPPYPANMHYSHLHTFHTFSLFTLSYIQYIHTLTSSTFTYSTLAFQNFETKSLSLIFVKEDDLFSLLQQKLFPSSPVEQEHEQEQEQEQSNLIYHIYHISYISYMIGRQWTHLWTTWTRVEKLKWKIFNRTF